MVLELNKRKLIIDEINGSENKSRKAESFKQCDIFHDRMYQYVWERLREFNSEQTVKEIPIISSVNLARRIVKEEASIYSEAPERQFTDLSDQQIETVEQIYKDMCADPKLMRSNEMYKLQNQGMLQVIPKDGKLMMRVLKMHHFDVIPDPQDPEVPLAVIISGFDRTSLRENFKDRTATGYQGPSATYRSSTPDYNNQKIGDEDDYKIQQRLVWWTKDYHFLTNGHGEFIDDFGNPIQVEEQEIVNPLGALPFVDIYSGKDFEYFVREGTMITDFTIDFNSILSEMEQVMRMQGFSVGVLKAPDSLMPESLVVGPNNILRLTVDTETQGETSFDYASPNADVPGAISLAEFILASFLSSRGLDPSTVSGSPQANRSSSGVERLLSMVEKFDASKEDFAIYERVEQQVYGLIKKWHNVLKGTKTLDPKYQTAIISEESDVAVVFQKPEMIQTQKEQMELIELKIEQGLMSKVDAIMELENLDREAAIERLKEIEEDEAGDDVPEPVGVPSFPEPLPVTPTPLEVELNADQEE